MYIYVCVCVHIRYLFQIFQPDHNFVSVLPETFKTTNTMNGNTKIKLYNNLHAYTSYVRMQ